MSINVTVHGNPVSISRGKMVTCDADAEFDRRRKIRLQQVRQQSKDIAANVRNRVRKEKEKQLSTSEKQGEQDLKRWQTRKLLTLQQQYRDCIKEVGSAHTRAALERDPAEILTEIGEKNQKESDKRGKQAHEKLHKDEAQRKTLETKPAEQLKLARKIENTRSAMVSKLGTGKLRTPRKKKKRKNGVDITITANALSRSCSESDVENFSSPRRNSKSKKSKADQLDSSYSSCASKSPINMSITSNSEYDSDMYSPRSKRKTQRNSPERHSKSPEKHLKSPEKQLKSPQKHLKSPEKRIKSPEKQLKSPEKYNKNQEQRNKYSNNRSNRDLSPQEIKELINLHRALPICSTNTQISDRIRHRHLTEFDSDDDTTDFRFISNDISGPNSPAKTNKFNIESYKICDIKSSKHKKDLPYVPTTTLRPSCTNLNSNENQVQYYDHANRFAKEYSSGPIVQKLNKDNVHVDTCSQNENDEFLEKMRKQDRDAHSRGVKAMEKVKIQKDYKQLLEELPVLQKQERMAQIRTHNPKYHMDEERLRALERRRQAQIENIFEKYVHKCKTLETPIITIQPKQKSPPNEDLKIPFRALDVTGSTAQLNVGAWTTEECKDSGRKTCRSTETEKTTSRSDKSTASESKCDLASKQKTLANLLQRVNNQRDLLLKEVSDLPPSSKLNNILKDDELIKLLCPCPKEKNAKEFVSTGTSPLLIRCPNVVQKFKAKAKQKQPCSNSTSNSSICEKKKRKRAKPKKTLLIRNIETQTSPLVLPSAPFCVSSKVYNVDNDVNKENADKLCEIIIKMAEETKIKIGTPENSNLIMIDKADGKPKKIPLQTDCSRKTLKSVDVSSSTTYMSPPEIQFTHITSKSNDSKSYKDYLHNKPQQSNIGSNKPTTSINSKSADVPTSTGKEINPQLMQYIKKLLSMSRQKIDEMATSSVSDVSTPGPSVLETSDNNSPLVQLQNVMNHFDLSFSDVQKYLSMSATSVDDARPTSPLKSQPTSPRPQRLFPISKSFDTATCPKMCDIQRRSPETIIRPRDRSPETSDTSSKSRETSPKLGVSKEPVASSFKAREYSPNRSRVSPKLNEIPSVSSDSSHRSRYLFATRESPSKHRLSSPTSRDLRTSAKTYEGPCTQALNSKKQDLLQLQADIDKLVKEAFGLDAQTKSELPYSTVFDRYTELTKATCDKISNLTAMIDKVRLEKEKLISPMSSDKNENSITSYMDLPPGLSNLQKTDDLESSSGSSINQDAVDRYLLTIGTSATSPRVNKGTSPTKMVTISSEEIEIEPYVPMLQGIPKYIEATQHACDNVLNLLDPKVNKFLANNKHKPPPSLLRRNNQNIDMVPHELSTIIELDTVISSKNVSASIQMRSKSPESKKAGKNTSVGNENVSNKNANMSDKSGFITISPERYYSPVEEVGISSKSKKKSPKKVKKKPQNDKIKADMSGIQPLSSDKSTSPEDMEVILRGLGLQWAVSTLKKTQEAMALSSSSSADSLKRPVGFEHSSSGTDVTLKEVLSRQFMKNSYISDDSRSIEIANISDFGCAVQSRDRSVQRTSTPVLQSRSSNSKNNDNLFTGDSDLSSVKLHNSDDMFLSIPNVTLDTNITLNKTKK